MRVLRKCISRKDPKGREEQAQQNNPGKDFQKIKLLEKKTSRIRCRNQPFLRRVAETMISRKPILVLAVFNLLHLIQVSMAKALRDFYFIKTFFVC